jgi:hypothetical protein
VASLFSLDFFELWLLKFLVSVAADCFGVVIAAVVVCIIPA